MVADSRQGAAGGQLVLVNWNQPYGCLYISSHSLKADTKGVVVVVVVGGGVGLLNAHKIMEEKSYI